MSCIIGYVDENKDIYFGGDSIGCSQDYLNWTVLNDQKIFIKNNMIFGYVGSIRLGQILKYDFNVPKDPCDIYDLKYFCSIFVPKFLKKINDRDYSISSDDSEKGEKISNAILIGYNGNLYTIAEDLQVLKSSRNFEAIGCGEEYVYGAMTMIEKYYKEAHPEVKILESFAVAEQFTMVKPPYHILKLPIKK